MVGIRRGLLAAVLAGVLYALALPPFGLWPLGWVCLVPLMLAVRGRPLRQTALLGLLAGWTAALLAGWWVWPAMRHGYDASWFTSTFLLLLVVGPACGVAPCVAALLAEWSARSRLPLPRVLSWPLAWAFAEWVRTTGLLGPPWGLLAATQSPVPLHLQVADLGGPVFLSALLMVVNACIAESIATPERRRRLVASAAGVYALMVAYGGWCLAHAIREPTAEETAVALVQGNVASTQVEVHRMLTHRAHLAKPAVVVWPAGAWGEHSTDARSTFADELRGLTQPGQGLIVGFTDTTGGVRPDARRYVAAAGVTHWGFHRFYRKRRLVPFAEYAPLGIRALDLGGARRDSPLPLLPGPPAAQMLEYHDHGVIGALIGSEFLYPGLLVDSVAAGARWFAVLGDDAGYDRTPGAAQLHAQLALAAVATRRYVVRATNTGGSGGFDAWGRPLRFDTGEVVWPDEAGATAVRTEGLPARVRTTLPRGRAAWGLLQVEPIRPFSVFARTGNWPTWAPMIFWITYAGLLLLQRRTARP